ncbi:MAG: NADH pyrophosphatase [Chloroflexi bacterium ADurb.Bin325]|nr:MAG: NADH pyrophosphatase [Chloroflexi bacterium ADurb.Bin325]
MGREDQGVQKSRHRYQVIPRVLCFVTHDDAADGAAVLLLRGGPHKRLWANRYNGLGGHVESGEDIYAATRREVREEAGLEIHDLLLRAVVHADAGDPTLGILFFVFTARADSRAVTPSAEGALEWRRQDALPLAEMVEDLPVLLPKVLAMQPADPPLFVAYSYDDADRLQMHFAERV